MKCYKVTTFPEDKNNFDLNIEKLQQNKKATFLKFADIIYLLINWFNKIHYMLI